MAANSKWRLLWSDKTYTLSDVVQDLGTPVLVKVDESIYEINDERFTPGDLLQIHSERTVPKVLSRVLEGSHGGGVTSKTKQTGSSTGEDISIPIEYKRGLTICRRDAGHKVYQTGRQLGQELPRYVRAIDDFADKRGYTINAKSDIELIQKENGGGLSCLCGGYAYTLSLEQPMKCLLLADNTVYTIQELIDRYPLPQIVKFSKAESPNTPGKCYTGMKDLSLDDKYIEIRSVIKQEVLICTLNPPSLLSNSVKDKPASTMLVIPVDSITSSQLEVKIPQQPKHPTYEAILAKTDPKTNAAITAIEETLDTVHYPNVLFVPFKPKPQVPRRPEKRRTPRGKIEQARGQSTSTEQKNDDGDDDDYEPVGEPRHDDKYQKPKPADLPKITRSISLPSAEADPSIYPAVSQEYEEDEDHPYDEISLIDGLLLPDSRRKFEPDTIKSIVSKVPMRIRECLLNVHDELKRKTSHFGSGADNTSSKQRKERTLSNNSDGRKAPERTASIDKPPVLDPGPAVPDDPARQPKKQVLDRFVKFANKIKPKPLSSPSFSKHSGKFSALDTNHLAAYLRRCNLHAMADMVEANDLNGKFFDDVAEEVLESTFGLTKIQIMKFGKMRDIGWEPKT